MARVRNPSPLSLLFKVDSARLAELGVLNSTPAVDTRLFMDPLLLRQSVHHEMNTMAAESYTKHFELAIKFLLATKQPNDVAWRSARRLFEFHEIEGTCLGYGAASIRGSGFGRQLSDRVLAVGKEVVDLGITDPDLFQAMALFEAGIGPDRISDMTTNIVFDALVAFNQRTLDSLGLKGEDFEMKGIVAKFLMNPLSEQRVPIILVPTDVLRHLPTATDWDDVADAASKNEAIRNRVNKHIGHMWAKKSRRQREILKEEALASKQSFETLLAAIKSTEARPYSVANDENGLVRWAELALQYARENPVDLLEFGKIEDLDSLKKVVGKIVSQFEHLIEHRGLNRELYRDDGTPKPEATAQRLFFAVAFSYCEANNVDISPEVDTGNGLVDFKLSKGYNAKVLVELKLSTSSKVVAGYEAQLETYKTSERTEAAYYVVMDVGRMGRKHHALLQAKNKLHKAGVTLSELVVIDAVVKPTASKR